MHYEINDTYGYDGNYSYLKKVIKNVKKAEKLKNVLFSITFVSEEEIKKLNKEYRSKDQVTDVISFAFLDGYAPTTKYQVLGDIYICIPRMKEQAIRYGHSEKRELSFLVVHGLLHLLGYDHMQKDMEEEMFKKQEVILNAAGIKR